jgi:acyl-coenzyme A synthetase/AMP-(fatty) acid ligase
MSAWLGAYVMLMKKYTLDDLLHLSSRIKANTLRIVPPIAFAMTKSSKLEEYDLNSVKYIMCSGAALKEDVIDELQKRLNKSPIFQGYGYVCYSVCEVCMAADMYGEG